MTLYELFVSLFGEYEPIAVAVNGVTQYSTNFGYIACVSAFLIVLYCCFRILGGILK